MRTSSCLSAALAVLLIAGFAISAPPVAAPVADAARIGDLDAVRALPDVIQVSVFEA